MRHNAKRLMLTCTGQSTCPEIERMERYINIKKCNSSKIMLKRSLALGLLLLLDHFLCVVEEGSNNLTQHFPDLLLE